MTTVMSSSTKPKKKKKRTSKVLKSARILEFEELPKDRVVRPPALSSTPRADPVEVIQLVKRAQRGNLSAQDEVVRANMGFVYDVARGMARATNKNADDLVQEGVLGLLRAIEDFDESFGVRFLTHAGSWVRQFMGRYIERDDAMMQGTLHLITNFRRSLKEYDRLCLSGVPPEEALKRVAKTIKAQSITPRVLAKYFNILRTIKAHSLDITFENGDSLIDLTPGNEPRIDDAFDNRRRDERVRAVAESIRPKLSRLEAATLDLRILPPKGDYKTLQEIGERVGVSRERVRQVENIVLQKLKKALLKGIAPTDKGTRGVGPCASK
jgi:RNA polymerase sigma factor (sigma-70 family)